MFFRNKRVLNNNSVGEKEKIKNNGIIVVFLLYLAYGRKGRVENYLGF